MKQEIAKVKRVPPEKVVSILSEHGRNVTLEEAEMLLDFLYEIAPIALRQAIAAEQESPMNTDEKRCFSGEK